MHQYETVRGGVAVLADQGVPSSQADALWVPPTLNMGGGATVMQKIALGHCSIINRSSATVAVGLAARIMREHWRAGQISDTNVYTDDTDDAQDTDNDDFPLEVAGGAEQGFLVASPEPFNLLCVRVTTASVGAGAERRIYVPTGTSTWTRVQNPIVAPPAGAWAAGAALIWWERVPSQVVLASGHVSGDNRIIGWHAVKIVATIPPTTAAVARSLSPFECVLLDTALTDNGRVELNPGNGSEHKFKVATDGLFGIISDVTDPQNVFMANVRLLG